MMQKAAILVSLVACFNLAAAAKCPNIVQTGNAIACNCEGLRILCKSINLNSIPTFVADDTPYEELDLTGNSLTSIGSNAFQNLKVRKISFGEDKISDITNNNKLASIDPNAFSGLEAYTREIALVGNNINDYSQAITAIKELVNLERITLIDFLQRGIQQSDFGSFIYLQYIKLHSLPLATISSNSFSQNSELNTLKLINTRLDQSVVSLLHSLPQSVTSLSLEEGQLTQLTEQFFSGMTNLKELDLSSNQINIIDDTAFQGIESTITHLNLRGNSLNAQQIANIGDLTALLDLKLGTNHIGTFPSNNFLKLENLDMIGNQLPSLLIQRDFPNLLTLDISENLISGTNENSFGHLPKLKSFIMTGQKTITIVINSFLGSHSTLEYLDLSQLGTAALDESSTWEAIKFLSKLKTLKLQQSKIRTIPDFEFENMQQLEAIDLSNNELSSVTQEMFHGLKGSLKKVDFASNQITSINRCVFQEFNLLDTLGLAYNPLHCDCLLIWLVQWHRVHVDDFTSIPWECATPPSLATTTFEILLEDDIKTCPVGVTQPTCPNHYTTIATQFSTKTDTTVKITWTVNDQTFISSFSIRYRPLPNGLATTISNISKDEPFEKEVERLTVNQRYHICVIINLLDTLSSFKPESCVEVITVEIPQVAITVISNDPSNFKIGWTVTDYQYVLGYEISYTELPDGKEEVLENILETVTEKILTNIKLNMKYEICVVVKLQDTIGAVSPRECTQKKSSSTMEGTTARTESADDSWVVIVAVIGGVIFLIVIVIIIFLLLRERRAKRMDKEAIPPGAVIQQTFDASAVGGTNGAVAGATAADYSHRFRQNEQKGPKTNNNIDVKVVSSGKLGPTRMSAGSYQFLDETSPSVLGMRPSTSSAYSSNYVNSTGERPLPDQPKDRYKNNSVVSTNLYDEINDKGISNDAFEPTTPTGSPTRLDTVAPDRKESSPRWSHSGSTAL